MEIISFVAGVIFAYSQVFLIIFVIFSLIFLTSNWKLARYYLLGILAALFHQYLNQDKGMPRVDVLSKASLVGFVTSVPIKQEGSVRFEFSIKQLNQQPVRAKIQLSCHRQCPVFKLGQRWQLDAKVKRPRNLANPGSFNYVNWLKPKHIYWTGYTKNGSMRLLSTSDKMAIYSLREKLAESISSIIPPGPSLGITQALTVGITTQLNKMEWDLFRRTGTTHLMVISGAHIGLVAGFCFVLIKWLWSLSSRLCLLFPASQAASLASVFSALIYAILAGFAPPAQRAFLATALLLTKNFLSWRCTAWQAWRYALLAVVIYEPHAVLMPGFYLSFIAVAILLLVNQRINMKGIKKAIYLQMACLLGLMPLSLYWFSYGSINGFLANLIAIPWVGMVIIPLALMNLLITQFFNFPSLGILLDFSIRFLLKYLHWIDCLSFINLTQTFSDILTPLCLLLALFLLVFLPIKAILPAVIILAIYAFFPQKFTLKNEEAQVDILDVGQGLSVVINTAKHTLIYDTGVRFFHGTDMGKIAIIPYLKTLGIRKIDKIVISHPDLDHRGGLASLEKNYAVNELLVNNPRFYHRGKNCHTYPAWEWDGIFFHFLAINKPFRQENNNSCVLQIKNRSGSILLTGDIEKTAEEYLLKQYGKKLRSEVLIIPHHGSKTSSTPLFIKAVAPLYGIISLGFDNRYHFPHQQTLDTLKRENVAIYNTIEHGMITFNLVPTGKIMLSTFKRN